MTQRPIQDEYHVHKMCTDPNTITGRRSSTQKTYIKTKTGGILYTQNTYPKTKTGGEGLYTQNTDTKTKT